jgi:hypothetical protein
VRDQKSTLLGDRSWRIDHTWGEVFLCLARSVLKVIFISIVAMLTLSSCARVAPYERGKLAHPTMKVDDMTGPGEEHVRSVQEGATGGSFAAGGGCGCN